MKNPVVLILKMLSLFLLALLCSGCAALDFGGPCTKESWGFRWGWNQAGVSEIGPEDPENPGFDTDGNVIPDNPEILNTYRFPDVGAGYAMLLQPKSRTTPVLGLEVFEFKAPYLRWFSVQAMAGDEFVGVYMGKRFTSIYEVTGGPFWGRDQRTNAETWGLAFTLLKF